MLGALLGLTGGCTAKNPPQTPTPEPAQQSETQRAKAPGPRPELTVDEQRVLENLSAHIEHLSGLGERTPQHPWELADAADYVARQLEDLGYPLERQGYASQGIAAQNLSVTVGGGKRGDQIILVGAHYDSPLGDPIGGVSATAALLELARLMRDAKLKRTVRFTAFALGETPHGDHEHRGSRVFAQQLVRKKAAQKKKVEREAEQRARGELPEELPPLPVDRSRLVVMISLQDLPSFSSPAAGSTRSVLVNVRSSEKARPFAGAITRALSADPMLADQARLVLEPSEDSDLHAFSEIGVPVVSVSGSRGEPSGAAPAGERESRSGKSLTSPTKGQDSVDLDALARVVMGIRAALGEMAEERPVHPGALAPSLRAAPE